MSHLKKFKLKAFLIVWLIAIVFFWSPLCDHGDAVGYALLVQWIILPISAFMTMFSYGKNEDMKKWFLIPVLGIMCVLNQAFTFDLANTLAFQHLNNMSWEFALNTSIPALIGMLLGSFRGTSK